jgi:hypothetical protein
LRSQALALVRLSSNKWLKRHTTLRVFRFHYCGQ